MSTTQQEHLPDLTILIEWENAIDVADEWTERAMRRLQAELEAQQARLSGPPTVLYLFNEKAVDEQTIRSVIERVAPRLSSLSKLRFVPTPGLTYYKLKNHGAQLATTPLTVMLDSDAGPEPGWLPALLEPFRDPDVMAVGGFTVLGYQDLFSKAMALSWIFDLRSERARTATRRKIHANNCAVRTEFFQQNPFPDLPAFKKQCGFWLRDLDARGVRWLRAPDAVTIHAPWPDLRFFLWRARTAGFDRDYMAWRTVGSSRAARVLYGLRFWAKKCVRTSYRIATKHREVDLPFWQLPAALLIGNGYFTAVLVSELQSALTRDFSPAHLEQATHH